MVKNEMMERVTKAIQTVGIERQNVAYSDLARAAIEAMLEPTAKMMEEAASEFTFRSSNWGPNTTPQTIQREVFRTAIDAALNPEDYEDETHEQS